MADRSSHTRLTAELLERRQLLWVVPSLAIWRRPHNLARGRPVFMAGFVLAVVVIWNVDVSTVTAGLLGLTLPCLFLGVYERILRAGAVARQPGQEFLEDEEPLDHAAPPPA